MKPQHTIEPPISGHTWLAFGLVIIAGAFVGVVAVLALFIVPPILSLIWPAVGFAAILVPLGEFVSTRFDKLITKLAKGRDND